MYQYALAPGTYVVELNFAEIYFTSPDAREFDVLIEGALVQNNLDIFETVGSNAALAVEYEVEVTDGFLSLSLTSEIENPKLSAFSIWTAEGDPVDPLPDTIDPTVSIAISGGISESDPAVVTVSYSDNEMLNAASIALDDLTISGLGSYAILSQNLEFGPGNMTATATYSVLETGGWSSGPVTFSVTGDAVQDMQGNGNAAASATYSQSTPFSGIAPVDSYTSGEIGSVEIFLARRRELSSGPRFRVSFSPLDFKLHRLALFAKKQKKAID